jgi:hypothetical protein
MYMILTQTSNRKEHSGTKMRFQWSSKHLAGDVTYLRLSSSGAWGHRRRGTEVDGGDGTVEAVVGEAKTIPMRLRPQPRRSGRNLVQGWSRGELGGSARPRRSARRRRRASVMRGFGGAFLVWRARQGQPPVLQSDEKSDSLKQS